MATQFGGYEFELDSVSGVTSVEDSADSQRLDETLGQQQLPNSMSPGALASHFKAVPLQTAIVVILVVLLWRILCVREKEKGSAQSKKVKVTEAHAGESQGRVESDYHTYPGTDYFTAENPQSSVPSGDIEEDEESEEYFTADEADDIDGYDIAKETVGSSDTKAKAALESPRPAWKDPPCIMTIPLSGQLLELDSIYPMYGRIWRLLHHGNQNGDDLRRRLDAASVAKGKPDCDRSVGDKVHLINQQVATYYESLLELAEHATQSSWLVDVPSMKDRLNEEQSKLLSPVLDSVEVLSKVNDLKTVTSIVGKFNVDAEALYNSIEPVINDARTAGKEAISLLERASQVRLEAIDAFQKMIGELEDVDKQQTSVEAQELIQGLKYAIWREANGIKWLQMQKQVILRVEDTFSAYDKRYKWVNAWGKLMWAMQLGTRLMDIKACEKYVDRRIMQLGAGDAPTVPESSLWLLHIDSILYPLPREGKNILAATAQEKRRQGKV